MLQRARELRRQGYVVVPGVLDTPMLTALKQRYSGMAALTAEADLTAGTGTFEPMDHGESLIEAAATSGAETGGGIRRAGGDLG